VLLGGLAVWGLLLGWRHQRAAVLLAALLLVIPVVSPIVASHQNRVLFSPRYGIASIIGLCWLSAQGAVLLGRRVGLIFLAILGFTAAPNLVADLYRGSTAEFRPDIKHATVFVEDSASPGDGILCTDALIIPVFAAYSHRSDLILLNAISRQSKPERIWLLTPDAPAEVVRLLGGTSYHLASAHSFTGVYADQVLAD
jgi:hypothetical protein